MQLRKFLRPAFYLNAPMNSGRYDHLSGRLAILGSVASSVAHDSMVPLRRNFEEANHISDRRRYVLKPRRIPKIRSPLLLSQYPGKKALA